MKELSSKERAKVRRAATLRNSKFSLSGNIKVREGEVPKTLPMRLPKEKR